uniref:Uncharacterized protein n=1 Tax=Florenciella sp. virus SA2 TaxID=3240092 RepID=A0AB39J7P2_9VIRU
MNNNIYINIEKFNCEDDTQNVINIIEDNYKLEKEFKLIIETNQLNRENVSLNNVYYISKWLIKLKTKKVQYLKHTMIKIYNNHIYNLLYFLFTYLSKPIAPVEVIMYEKNHIEKVKTFYP